MARALRSHRRLRAVLSIRTLRCGHHTCPRHAQSSDDELVRHDQIVATSKTLILCMRFSAWSNTIAPQRPRISEPIQRRHHARAPPWSSSTGLSGLHASERVVVFPEMRSQPSVSRHERRKISARYRLSWPGRVFTGAEPGRGESSEFKFQALSHSPGRYTKKVSTTRLCSGANTLRTARQVGTSSCRRSRR